MNLTTVNTPFLFQQENYTRGMRFSHTGEFIHPNGDFYEYPSRKGMIPLGWNFCYSDINNSASKSVDSLYGYVSPENLFANLNIAELKVKGAFKSRLHEINNINELIKELILENEKNFKRTIVCDGPLISQNVYLYRENLKLYERFTLRASGDITVNHDSKAIIELLGLLGFNWFFE